MDSHDRIEQITELASMLSESAQEDILKELKKAVILEKAKKLTNSVRPNPVTMQEIVEEVREVRKNRGKRD